MRNVHDPTYRIRLTNEFASSNNQESSMVKLFGDKDDTYKEQQTNEWLKRPTVRKS